MVTSDGTGVVSRAGTVLLSELAGCVVAAAIADGATTNSDVQALADQQGLPGPTGSVASTPTIWRVLAGIDAAMLAEIRQARALARDRAWLARGEPTGLSCPGRGPPARPSTRS